MSFKFSLTRLLTAIGAFAVPLALFSRMGIAGAIVSAVVGICFSLISLIVQVSDIRPTIRIIIAAFLGLVFGMMLTPTVRPPGQPGDEIRYSIGGIMLGCFCGLIWNTIKPSEQTGGGNRDEQSDTPKSPVDREFES